MDQYGDSITFGSGPGATQSDVDTMRVAAALGFTGSTHGISGHTIAMAKTLLDNVLPRKTVTSADVAIIALGENDLPTIDATDKANYSDCIDKLLAKGCGKILCRGILPGWDGTAPKTAANAELQSVVTSKANPNVIWVPTSTWLGYGTDDGLHPNSAGYGVLASFAIPAYTAALGL